MAIPAFFAKRQGLEGQGATYRGPTGKRVSLVAAAQSPGGLDPGRGSTSTATSSTVKDAGTSSMPPPSVPSSALSKAGTAGSAASSQGSAAGQAPAAKGPPAPKIGGTPMVQGPPVRPSSDSAVMGKAVSTDPQTKSPLQGQFPTPAESVGKAAPVKKPPPTGKPKQRASSLCLKAAYASVSSTAAPARLRHLLEQPSQHRPLHLKRQRRLWKRKVRR